MAARHLINVDLAKVTVPADGKRKASTRILAWRDLVEKIAVASKYVEIMTLQK